ncbi:TPA: hypothetical protein AB5H60_003036 [Vibrio mimicus]
MCYLITSINKAKTCLCLSKILLGGQKVSAERKQLSLKNPTIGYKQPTRRSGLII